MSELTIRTYDELGGFTLRLSPDGWELYDNFWFEKLTDSGNYPIPEDIIWLGFNEGQIKQIKKYEAKNLKEVRMDRLIQEALEELQKADYEQIVLIFKTKIREAYEAGYFEGFEVGKESHPTTVGGF